MVGRPRSTATRLTRSGYRPERNPAAQQTPAAGGCAILSVGSTEENPTVNRREFVSLLGGAAAAWPLAARAQQGRLPVVGVLRINPRDFETFAEPFRRDMNKLGWEEGRNIRFEFVWAGGRNEDV